MTKSISEPSLPTVATVMPAMSENYIPTAELYPCPTTSNVILIHVDSDYLSILLAVSFWWSDYLEKWPLIISTTSPLIQIPISIKIEKKNLQFWIRYYEFDKSAQTTHLTKSQRMGNLWPGLSRPNVDSDWMSTSPLNVDWNRVISSPF